MQPSDFLTILGLAIAIWSIIPNKERKFILLFFADWELWLFGISWLIVLYLMAFDWLQVNWFPWLSIFSYDKGIPANTFAFMIALFAISYPILKVIFSFFARQRLPDLIILYKSLIKENEIDLLVGYLNKYHMDDVLSYLRSKSYLNDNKDQSGAYSRRKNITEGKTYGNLVKPRRIKFAEHIYNSILQDKTFIKVAANKYPELFAKAYSGMKTKKTASKESVNLYIEILFENKNQSLINELKVVNGSDESIKNISGESNELPILSGLLVNTEAAYQNNVWYPVGQGAVKSLKYDNEQKDFLKRKYKDDLKSELWSCKVFIAMVYFNYMVRETIYRDNGWHMWLFYFRHTTDRLILNIPPHNNYKADKEYPSIAHFLLYKHFDIMLEWLSLSKELNTDNRVIDTIRCLGWCVHSICQADERKISSSFKKNQLNRLVYHYCDYAFYSDNKAVETAREWLKRMFLNPKGVDYGTPMITSQYIELLTDVWKEFDRAPFDAHGADYILEEFEKNILEPLGIKLP